MRHTISAGLSQPLKARIENMMPNRLPLLVCDTNGVDTQVQRFLADQHYAAVRVYCSGTRARNNVGNWPLRCVQSARAPGTRAYFTEKDVVMAQEADYGLMIWDMESTGTLSNVPALLGQGKKCVAYPHPQPQFTTIGDAAACQHLASLMTPAARNRAEQKINLQQRLAALAGLF